MSIVASRVVGEISIDGAGNAKIELKQVGQESDKLQRQLNLLRPASASASESLGGRFLGSLRSTGGGLLNLASQAGMAIFGIKELVGAAVQAGMALLRPHADLENFTASFKTFLGTQEAAKSMMGDIQKLADTIAPFESSQLAAGASNLLAMKVQAQDVVPFMTAIGNAVSGLNLESYQLGDIARLFGEINSTGYATGETLSQLRERGIDAYGILREKLGLTNDQLEDALANHKILASDALPALRDGLNQAFPDAMLNKSKTLDGRVSTIIDGFKKLYVETTKPIFTAVSEGAGKLVEVLSNPALIAFATGVGVQIGNVMQNIGNFVATQVVPGFQQLQPVVAYLSPIFAQLGTSLQNLGAVVAPLLVSFGQWLAHSGILQFAIAGIVVGVGLLAQGLTFLINGLSGIIVFFSTGGSNAKWLWNILVGIGAFLTSTFAPLWRQLVTIFQTQILPSWNQLVAAFQPAIPFFQLLGAVVGGILVVALGLLVGAIGGVLSGLAGLIGGLAQALGGVVQMISGVLQIILGVIGFFVDLFTGKWDKLGQDLMHIGTGIATFFVGLWQTVSGIFMAAFGFFYGIISGFGTSVIGFFTNLYNILVGHSIIPDMINGIVNWFAQLPGRVIAFIVNLFFQAVDFFRKMHAAIVVVAQTIVNGVVSWFQQLPGRAADAISGVRGRVLDVLSGVARSAYDAGSKIVKQIADGILAGIQFVKNAIGTVTKWISDHLPRSPAKIGPLRDLVKQGANITDQIGKGMLANLPQLQTRLNMVLSPVGSFVPAGARVAPAQMSQVSQPQIIVMPSDIILDGRRLTNAQMPYIVDGIRLHTGGRI